MALNHFINALIIYLQNINQTHLSGESCCLKVKFPAWIQQCFQQYPISSSMSRICYISMQFAAFVVLILLLLLKFKPSVIFIVLVVNKSNEKTKTNHVVLLSILSEVPTLPVTLPHCFLLRTLIFTNRSQMYCYFLFVKCSVIDT